MSIEAKIDELIAATAAQTAATDRNSALLERVVAGQEAALAKLEGGAAPRKPRASKANESPATDAATTQTAPAATETTTTVHPLLAAPNGETRKNAKQEDEPTENYRAADFSRQEVKNEFIGWLGGTEDADERKARAGFVGEVAGHFGVKLPFHPTEGLTEEEQFKQVLFFLRRKREGLKVDFSADYDFDGDPLADQTVEPVEDASGIDALG